MTTPRFPESIEQVSEAAIRAAMTARMETLLPAWEKRDTDPLTQDIADRAYREAIIRQVFNLRIARNLLDWAVGSDLDSIGAVLNTARNGERDTEYRARIKVAYAIQTPVGSKAWYLANALAADSQVIDAGTVVVAATKAIQVYILSSENDGGTLGNPSAALIAKVQGYLNADDRKHISDVITVHLPVISPFTANLTLECNGQEPTAQAITAAVDAYNAANQRIGRSWYRTEVETYFVTTFAPVVRNVNWNAGSSPNAAGVANTAYYLTGVISTAQAI